jgi:predicted DNA-binding transcriptional regulator AlpA
MPKLTNIDTIKTNLIEALKQSLGIVTTACKNVGISRETYYKWMREDDEFRQQVDDIGDIALDFAESQLHKQMKDGSTSATIFYLKTKGRKRGYIERQEFAIDNTRPDLSQLSIDEIKHLLNEPSKE